MSILPWLLIQDNRNSSRTEQELPEQPAHLTGSSDQAMPNKLFQHQGVKEGTEEEPWAWGRTCLADQIILPKAMAAAAHI
jgi:hypothetical protein